MMRDAISAESEFNQIQSVANKRANARDGKVALNSACYLLNG